jgi:hypothetical protein
MWFRAMSVRQRVALLDEFRAKGESRSATDMLDFQMAVIQATACDEQGNLVIDAGKAEALRDAEPALFADIANAAMKAAGLGGGDDRAKNSDETPSVDSPSV